MPTDKPVTVLTHAIIAPVEIPQAVLPEKEPAEESALQGAELGAEGRRPTGARVRRCG